MNFYNRQIWIFKFSAAVLAVWFTVSIVLSACGTDKPEPKEYTTTFPLLSVDIDGQTKSDGGYFLFVGSYSKSTEKRYYFYAEHPDGRIKLHNNDTDDISFKLIKDGSKPRIECVDEYEYDDLPTGAYMYLCTFFIPEDSIAQKYDMDPVK